jgi:hypothetical protein
MVEELAGTVAVGGPNLVYGNGWDPAPILLFGLALILVRAAGLRIGPATLVFALGAGLTIDLVTDAAHVSIALAVAPLVLTFALLALRRNPSS